jgi:hypothetical protein
MPWHWHACQSTNACRGRTRLLPWRSSHLTKRKVPRPDGGISISLHVHTVRTLSHAPQLLLLCPQTSFPLLRGSETGLLASFLEVPFADGPCGIFSSRSALRSERAFYAYAWWFVWKDSRCASLRFTEQYSSHVRRKLCWMDSRLMLSMRSMRDGLLLAARL